MALHRGGNVYDPWRGDNQSWWDWYLTLADNGGAAPGPLLAAPPLPDVPLPDDGALLDELAAPYPLEDRDAAFFRANGFVKLPHVLSPGAALRLRARLKALLAAEFGSALDSPGDRAEPARFLSLEMLWLEDPLVRAFVLSPRIAKLAADLLGVGAVRLYHDNILSKEPGSGRTPWHYDDHHFPLATHDVVTAWIAPQAIPHDMGPLAFAGPIDVHKLVEHVPFDQNDTSYDREVARIFRDQNVAVEDSPFAIGEVSFHHNLCFHTAGPNRCAQSRIVLANTFYADGARVVDRPTMVSGDWQKFIPDTGPGEPAISRLNPVCWPPAEDPAPPGPDLIPKARKR